jgi:hypothetical protein
VVTESQLQGTARSTLRVLVVLGLDGYSQRHIPAQGQLVKIRFWPLIASISLIFFVSSLFAQTPDSAIVRGQVLDQSRAAVVGVDVTLTNRQTGLKRSATTDSSGEFTIAGVPVSGGYDFSARKTGFVSADLKNVSLVGGTSATFNFVLKPGAENTEITVTGTAGEVRTDQPQIGVYLDESQVKEMPTLNRRITYLPLLNAANRPAISTGDIFMNQNLFTTNGAGRRQTWFEVDGGNGVDLWGRQTIFSNVPVDAVGEMTVLTNAFSAEYGASTGSVVNINTKTGSNRYHGSGIFVWRPSATSANLSGYTPTTATSGTQITGDNLKQTAATLSGPIGSSGRTHFFLDGEYSWENRTSPVTSPVAPGSFIGHYRGWMGFGRLDHQIDENNTLFLRLGADSFRDTNPGGAVGGNTLPSVGRVFRRKTYTAVLGETAVLSSTLLNNFRAQFMLASPITEFDPIVYGTQYQVPIAGVGTFTSGTSQSAKLLNHQYELNDTLAWTHGKHSFKYGVDVIRAHNGGNSKEFGGPIYLGQFIYKSCSLGATVCESQAYLSNIANVASYTQSYGNATYTVDDTLWSLFVQDDIRVSQALTLNVGLRYERQTFADSNKDFAPRVGFAYNLFGDGKTVIRGGYGIYYSQIPDNSYANYALSGPTGVFNYTASSGQVGFPTTVASAPLPAFPTGAVAPVRTIYLRPGMSAYYDQFLPTSVLQGYQNELLNPYSQQWTFGIERQLAPSWVLSMDYVGSRTIKINRPLDVDAPTSFVRTAQGQTRTAQAANCTRPYWVWWYGQHSMTCNPTAATSPQPPYALVTSDVNNGFMNYHALDVNLKHRLTRNFQMLASYTWSHALDNVDPDIPGQNPNDPNQTGYAEYGNAIFDQRHRFVLSGVYNAPFRINFGGFATLATGLPYNITTGSTNSGDNGATTDRPVVNGVVIARNAGRGMSIFDVSPFIERPFRIVTERVSLNLRAEAFNLFNHPNFVAYNGIYGNGVTPPATLGQPTPGSAAQLPARSLQFSAKLSF